MGGVSLQEMAALLPLDSEPKVVRPSWLNPASTEGAGLEFSVNATIEDLVRQHHNLLIVMSNIAQYMKVYCKNGDIPDSIDDHESEQLSTNRDETDMGWHTDQVHRNVGATTIIVGESSIPTGVASKPIIAQQCASQLSNINHPLYGLMLAHAHHLGNEPTGESYMHEESASDFLAHIHNTYTSGLSKQERMQKRIIAPLEFWDFIRVINGHHDIEWVAKTPDAFRERMQAVFVTGKVYHCKQYDPDHYDMDSDRKKSRLVLQPNLDLKAAIDLEYGLKKHVDSLDITMDWVRNLAKK